jgi:hypothetical protein
MATAPNPQPAGNTAWIQESSPTTIFLLYMLSLDKVVRNLVAGTVGPLTNATSDAAAAKVGVPINGLYRNGNAVQIRLT